MNTSHEHACEKSVSEAFFRYTLGMQDRASGKLKCLGSGGSMVAKLKLKGIDGRAPPGVEPVAQFDSTRENLPGPDIVRIDRLRALS